MINKKKVSKKANSMLTREATIRDAVPEFKKNRDKKAIVSIFAENAGNNPLDVIQAFTNCIFNGVTPPPNILTQIAENFAAYLDAETNTNTLDYSFDLSPKQKSGHPITHRKKRSGRGNLLFAMWVERKRAKEEGKRLSVDHAAEKVLSSVDNAEITVEALTKDYSSSRCDDNFEQLLKATIDLNSSMETLKNKPGVDGLILEFTDFLKNK